MKASKGEKLWGKANGLRFIYRIEWIWLGQVKSRKTLITSARSAITDLEEMKRKSFGTFRIVEIDPRSDWCETILEVKKA